MMIVKKPAFFSVGVMGYGRFGRLWTKILMRHFDTVAVADKENRDGMVEDTEVSGIFPCTRKELYENAKTIFLCVPISAVESALREMREVVSEDTLVCDTCSIKVKPIEWMKKHLSPRQPILATHPLFGPDSHDERTRAYNTIVTYPVNMKREDYAHWCSRFVDMNLLPLHIEPHIHDEQAAYSQGLTHLVGRVLEKMDLKNMLVSTKGYDALKEIVAQTCSDSLLLFRDLQQNNEYSREVHSKFRKAFAEVLRSLN